VQRPVGRARSHRRQCVGKSIRGDEIERIVWPDVVSWLRGTRRAARRADTEHNFRNVAAENEGSALEMRLVELEAEHKRTIALHVKGTLAEDELDQMLEEFATQRRAVEDRLAALSPPQAPEEPVGSDRSLNWAAHAP
jgi:hypothetical protein